MTAAADDEGFKGHAAGAAAAVRASGYTSQQLAKFRDARARASDAHQVSPRLQREPARQGLAARALAAGTHACVCVRAQVEATIVELGSMFHRLTSLVAEQGDTVDRIDADVDTACVARGAGGDGAMSRMRRCNHLPVAGT